MNSNNNNPVVALAAIVLAIVAVAASVFAIVQPAQAGEAEMPAKVETLEFDVAEDMNRFIFNQDITYEDGFPADGSNFITRGYLYPVGTLTDSNGVNPDGSPEFPDKVIGEWICEGYMINDAGHAQEGVWVFSTQFFQLSEEAGAETIITTGYELADLNTAISRAITGGTGRYSTAQGDSEQMLLGLNASEGVNLRVKINVSQ